MIDGGDVPVSPHDIQNAVNKCRDDIRFTILPKTKKLFVVGGDHTISYPVLSALSKYNLIISKRKINLNCFTNNLCLWYISIVIMTQMINTIWKIKNYNWFFYLYFGCPITHGTPFKRAVEEKAIDPFKNTFI